MKFLRFLFMFFMRNEAISFELLIFFCGTLEGFHGTLGFRGTQFEDHWSKLLRLD